MFTCGAPEAAGWHWQAQFVAVRVVEQAKTQALEDCRDFWSTLKKF